MVEQLVDAARREAIHHAVDRALGRRRPVLAVRRLGRTAVQPALLPRRHLQIRVRHRLHRGDHLVGVRPVVRERPLQTRQRRPPAARALDVDQVEQLDELRAVQRDPPVLGARVHVPDQGPQVGIRAREQGQEALIVGVRPGVGTQGPFRERGTPCLHCDALRSSPRRAAAGLAILGSAGAPARDHHYERGWWKPPADVREMLGRVDSRSLERYDRALVGVRHAPHAVDRRTIPTRGIGAARD